MNHTENHLIERFPKELQRCFLEHCEIFELVPSSVLGSQGDVLTHAYFPRSGLVTLVIDVHNRPVMEVGSLGRESMLGSELLLGKLESPWRSVVQVAGTCWRIESSALRRAMAEMPALHASLQNDFLVRVHQRQARASSSFAVKRRESLRLQPRYFEQLRSQLPGF